jgi:hypothetical protein
LLDLGGKYRQYIFPGGGFENLAPPGKPVLQMQQVMAIALQAVIA